MEQFKKWQKTFYKNHQGIHHFDPTCKIGWRAALEEVLKHLDHFYGGDFENSEIVEWIKRELGDI